MGVKPEEIFDALKSQTVEIVLTAHPTEVNRRTMLRKFRRIKEILQMIDRPDNSLYDLKLLNDQLRSEIFSVWESDNLRRRKPTPVEEAKGGLAILENVLWHAVPTFLRKLDHAVVDLLHERLPPECAPIKVASWMG